MTRTETPKNPHETAARLRKASRILSVLDDAWRELWDRNMAPEPHFSPAWLDRLTDEDWAGAAVIAGCRPPSADTRELVLAIVREREAICRQVAS